MSWSDPHSPEAHMLPAEHLPEIDQRILNGGDGSGWVTSPSMGYDVEMYWINICVGYSRGIQAVGKCKRKITCWIHSQTSSIWMLRLLPFQGAKSNPLPKNTSANGNSGVNNWIPNSATLAWKIVGSLASAMKKNKKYTEREYVVALVFPAIYMAFKIALHNAYTVSSFEEHEIVILCAVLCGSDELI